MDTPTVLGYMHDQPRALRAAFEKRNEYLEPFAALLRRHDIRKVVFLGSGTSYNASLISEYYFKHVAGIAAEAFYPTVFTAYEKADWLDELKPEQVLCFGISQSGTSISTVDAMKEARRRGHLVVALTEDLNSEITHHVDTVLHLLCGKELTPPETRGYTVTMLQMYLFAWTCALERGVCTGQDYNQAIIAAKELVDGFDKVVEDSELWFDHNACSLVNSDRIFVLGYGIDVGSAWEGMLKIGEMLRIPTIGYELEEFSHGPTMGLGPKQSIIIIAADEVEFKRAMTFREAFLQYTPRVFVITSKEVSEDKRNIVFSVAANKLLAPIAYTVPMQFVAAKGALLTDIDTSVNPFKVELSHLPNE